MSTLNHFSASSASKESAQNQQLSFDFQATESFLNALDAHGAPFYFQTFDDTKSRKDHELARNLYAPLNQVTRWLETLQRRGAGAFVSINDFAPGSRRLAENVTRIRALFADFDPPDTAPAPSVFPLLPSIIVETSAGKRHVYWRVTDCPVNRFVEFQERIIAALGSDKAIKNLDRVMRLPGSHHLKDAANPQRVKIIEQNDVSYSIAEFDAAFPAIEIAPRAVINHVARVKSVGGDTNGFFSTCNTDALNALHRWFPVLLPDAKTYREGFRVSSKLLGRDREEDLAAQPNGIFDFGDEHGLTPIDCCLKFGSFADARDAALWLCSQLCIAPESIGYGLKSQHADADVAADETPAPAPDIPKDLDAAIVFLVKNGGGTDLGKTIYRNVAWRCPKYLSHIELAHRIIYAPADCADRYASLRCAADSAFAEAAALKDTATAVKAAHKAGGASDDEKQDAIKSARNSRARAKKLSAAADAAQSAAACTDFDIDADAIFKLADSIESNARKALKPCGSLTQDIETLKLYKSVDFALALINRHSWRFPNKITPSAMAAHLCEALGDDTHKDLFIANCEWHIDMARNRLAASRKLTADAIVDSARHARRLAWKLHEQGKHHHFLSNGAIGTGKTQNILKPIANALRRVLLLTYRVSLVDNLVNEFDDFISYQELPDNSEITYQRIVGCIDSLMKAPILARFGAVDAVLIDEVHHVLKAVHNQSGTMKKRSGTIARSFFSGLKAAPFSYGVDANLCDTDVQVYRDNGIVPFVIAIRGIEPVVIVSRANKVKHFIITASLQSIYDEALDALKNGEKVCIAASSASAVLKIHRYLSKECPDKTFRVFNQKTGYATAGEPEQIEFLKRINAEVLKVDCLIYNSTVESGVSITVKCFTKHYGIFDGTNAADDFIQMLGRDRTMTECKVAIAGSGTKKPSLSSLAIQAQALLACQLTQREHGIDAPIELRHFDVHTSLYQAIEQRDKTYYGQSLSLLLEAQGHRVTYVMDGDSIEFNEQLGELKDEIKADFVDAAKKLPVLSAAQHSTLESAYRVDTKESQQVLAYDICNALGATQSELNVADVEIYSDGFIETQLQNYQLAVAPLNDDAVATDRTDAAVGVDLSLRSNIAARRQAVRAIVDASGFDFERGTGKIDADGALNLWSALAESPVAQVISRYYAQLEKKPTKDGAIKWLGGMLKKFGLWLGGGGKNGGLTYRLGADVKRDTKGRIKAPGIDVMRNLVAQKQLSSAGADDVQTSIPAQKHLSSAGATGQNHEERIVTANTVLATTILSPSILSPSILSGGQDHSTAAGGEAHSTAAGGQDHSTAATDAAATAAATTATATATEVATATTATEVATATTATATEVATATTATEVATATTATAADAAAGFAALWDAGPCDVWDEFDEWGWITAAA